MKLNVCVKGNFVLIGQNQERINKYLPMGVAKSKKTELNDFFKIITDLIIDIATKINIKKINTSIEDLKTINPVFKELHKIGYNIYDKKNGKRI